MRSNQLRVLFSTMAYVLQQALREFGLKGTSLASAQVSTIRSKLLKIGGRIRVSVRRVELSGARLPSTHAAAHAPDRGG